MFKTSASSGFTLIELMVVMVILGIMGALVGPNLLKTLERQDENIEKQIFFRQLEHASVLAYSREQRITVKLSGKRYSLLDRKEVLLSTDTTRLFFPPQTLSISSSGIIDNHEVQVVSNGQKSVMTIPLPTMVK